MENDDDTRSTTAPMVWWCSAYMLLSWLAWLARVCWRRSMKWRSNGSSELRNPVNLFIQSPKVMEFVIGSRFICNAHSKWPFIKVCTILRRSSIATTGLTSGIAQGRVSTALVCKIWLREKTKTAVRGPSATAMAENQVQSQIYIHSWWYWTLNSQSLPRMKEKVRRWESVKDLQSLSEQILNKTKAKGQSKLEAAEKISIAKIEESRLTLVEQQKARKAAILKKLATILIVDNKRWKNKERNAVLKEKQVILKSFNRF